ncbi:hypothetical protein [Homoserinimonas sp. A520]
MTRLLVRGLVTACAGVMILTGCGQAISGGDGIDINPPVPRAAIPAAGEVLGQGTVLQLDGGPVEFCLGAVAESYPPQCSGPELIGWDWASVDGEEAASSVTWGTYAVQGTWDGERMTVTQPPIMLALYDPMAVPDPLRDPANAGETPEAELMAIQDELHELGTVDLLASGAQNGYLFVSVVYDDGQIQEYYDELYGEGVVVVESVLRPVTG